MKLKKTIELILSFVLEYSLLFIFIIFPFSKYRINIPSFFFFVSGFLLLFFVKDLKQNLFQAFKNNALIVWPFFFSLLFGILNSKHFDTDFIVLNLPFILIPILLYIHKKHLPKNLFQNIILVSSISVFVFMSIQLYAGFTFYLETNSTDALFYTQLFKNTTTHPTILSLLVNFLIFGSLYLLLKNYKSFHSKSALLLFNVIIMSVFLLFIASRIGILFFVVFSFFSMLGYAYYKSRLVVYSLLFFVVSGMVVSFTYYNFPRLVKRFEKLSSTKIAQFESRQYIWKASIDLIKEAPFLGYSNPIYLKENMVEKFNDMNFEKGKLQAYNSHNQFLEFFLLYGFVGFLIFIFSLYSAFRVAYKNKEYVILLVSSLLVVYSMTDTILETQNGIIFFVVLFSLLLNVFDFKPNYR